LQAAATIIKGVIRTARPPFPSGVAANDVQDNSYDRYSIILEINMIAFR
jgi:hypothetical protein